MPLSPGLLFREGRIGVAGSADASASARRSGAQRRRTGRDQDGTGGLNGAVLEFAQYSASATRPDGNRRNYSAHRDPVGGSNLAALCYARRLSRRTPGNSSAGSDRVGHVVCGVFRDVCIRPARRPRLAPRPLKCLSSLRLRARSSCEISSAGLIRGSPAPTQAVLYSADLVPSDISQIAFHRLLRNGSWLTTS